MSKEHLALYRKYRPAKWGEVRGQEHIVRVLEAALKKSEITHAYLFAGSRGTGKTTVARIFANALDVKPHDINEIDAASNRGIDDVRALREGVAVMPFESPYKVYIIDEVHMLTKEAFNALLKTLEEPPKHAIFILATTEIGKLPETIVSRCQTHTFKKPSHTLLKKFVLDTAKKEGLNIDAESADVIALVGDGSFRDALGILQKVATVSSDSKISREEIDSIIGAPSGKLVNDFIGALAESNAGIGLSAIATAAEYNVDMKIYCSLILRKLRAVLLLRFAPDMKSTLQEDFSEEDFAFLFELASDKKANISSETLVAFLECYQQIGSSYLPQLPLELTVIKLTNNK